MRRLIPLATALALLLAACASPDGAPGARDDAQPGAAQTPGAAETGEVPGPREPGATGTEAVEPGATAPEATRPGEAPDGPGTPEALAFEAPLLGGGTFDGGDHDGRDVALWFWAPW